MIARRRVTWFESLWGPSRGKRVRVFEVRGVHMLGWVEHHTGGPMEFGRFVVEKKNESPPGEGTRAGLRT